MHPKLISLGVITVYTYGFFVAIGILLGYELTLRLAKYRSISKEFISYILLGAVFFGILGARAGYILIAFDEFIENIYRIFMFWEGGLVFWGGLICGGLWVAASSLRWGLNVWSVADVLAPGIALGHAFGRLGCFFAGCCYGSPTGSPLHVIFTDPESLARPLGVPLHPTQLYSSGFLFILSALLYKRIKSPNSKPLSVFGLYILGYSIFRILIEFLRGDYRGGIILGFTPTQWIAVFGTGLGAFLLYKSRRING